MDVAHLADCATELPTRGETLRPRSPSRANSSEPESQEFAGRCIDSPIPPNHCGSPPAGVKPICDRGTTALADDLWSAKRALPALVRRDVGGGDGRSGRVRALVPWTMTDAATGRQIGSACLIMPDTCPDQPTARCLACSGRGSSVP